MTVLFFSLRGVPDDEADDVRVLLAENDIAYYETPAGSWGLSMPAIWLYSEDDAEKIRPLFDEYQRQRAHSQRALYLQLKRQGRNGFFVRHLRSPLPLIFYGSGIVLTAYLSVKWIFELGL